VAKSVRGQLTTTPAPKEKAVKAKRRPQQKLKPKMMKISIGVFSEKKMEMWITSPSSIRSKTWPPKLQEINF
jgi:hypothetical protein